MRALMMATATCCPLSAPVGYKGTSLVVVRYSLDSLAFTNPTGMPMTSDGIIKRGVLMIELEYSLITATEDPE